MDAQSLSVDVLARHCQEETGKFRLQQAHNPEYCFELMRRALADGMQAALTYIMQIYEQQVTRWVRVHPAFTASGESADYFVSQVFFTFYRHASGEKFARFPSLAAALQYLKRCVWSCVRQYVRDFPDREVGYEDIEWLPADEPFDRRLRLADILGRIHALLPDERDRLLMDRIYIYGYKPADLCSEFPAIWEDARAVSVALQRVHRKLRKDGNLRDLLGLMPEATE
jgi:hypothetical protein